MAIQLRKGADADFNPNRLVPGEIAILLTSKKVKVAFSDGEVKEFLLTEDAEDMISDLIEELSLSKFNPVGTGSLSLQRKSGTTTGTYSVVLGFNNEASGVASNAIGVSNKASGSSSAAIGAENSAEGIASAAIGHGARSIDDGCVSVGRYNSVHLPGGTDRVFQVGNGTDDLHRSTAFEIEEDGTARFYGNIYAPMFKYQNGTAVQIGVDGAGNPIKRMTVYGTDTSSWNASGQVVMSLESTNIIVTNMNGFIRFNDGADNIIAAVRVIDIIEDEVRVQLYTDQHQSAAKYCITVEYILLS